MCDVSMGVSLVLEMETNFACVSRDTLCITMRSFVFSSSRILGQSRHNSFVRSTASPVRLQNSPKHTKALVTMAAADTQKLDKSTPDKTWREVLGTAEVSAHAEISL